MPGHRKFPIDRETLGEMVGRALYEARDNIGVVEATLIERAVAVAPRVAFGVWDDRVHDCRCPIGTAYPADDLLRLETRDEYLEFVSSFDTDAKRYVYNEFNVGLRSGVLEVR